MTIMSTARSCSQACSSNYSLGCCFELANEREECGVVRNSRTRDHFFLRAPFPQPFKETRQLHPCAAHHLKHNKRTEGIVDYRLLTWCPSISLFLIFVSSNSSLLFTPWVRTQVCSLLLIERSTHPLLRAKQWLRQIEGYVPASLFMD